MDYTQQYRQKLTSAEQAVKAVRSGDWVDFGWSVNTPALLDRALAARYEQLADVKIRGGLVLHRPAVACVPDAAEHFLWNAWHTSAAEREMVREGLAFYAPMRFSEVARYYQEDLPPVDVAMIQTAPMDEKGVFNFGPNPAFMAAVCRLAKVVIVEVNRRIPRCAGLGGNGVHISHVDMIVEGDDPPMEQLLPDKGLTRVDKAIARLVVPQIPDGACLQLGIGRTPNAIGRQIAASDLRDLGVHSELYAEAFVDLDLAGKLTGARKSFDRGLQTYAVALGSRRLYEHIGRSRSCMAAPVEYVNDVSRLARMERLISVNGAVDVDLFGQVSSETSGLRHISGAGGQLDFVLGAYLSPGGKSFICFPSTVTDKRTGQTVSRIRPTLAEGSVVTCPRNVVQYLVTEYGMVNVKGLTVWQRAEAIIGLAHPSFRDELIRQAERNGLWRRTNKKPDTSS